MSNLRRSRPDEQDAALKRLQKISLTHHRLSSSEQNSPSFQQRSQQCKDADNKNACEFHDEDSSPPQEVSDLVFQPEETSRLVSPVSPKPRTRSSLDSVGKGYATLPLSMSPAKRNVRMLSSPMLSSENNNGSKSVAGMASDNEFLQRQLSVTDTRWEKLRSVLVKMKAEPFNVEEYLHASPDLLVNLPGKLSTQDELQLEISTLQSVLKKKKFQLQQAEEERDSALAYIRHMKVNSEAILRSPESGHDILKLYERGIEGLRESNVSKDSILALLSPLVKELHKQKSYLDRLITVVLMRVPWIMEEVDKMELPNKDQPFFSMDDDGGDETGDSD